MQVANERQQLPISGPAKAILLQWQRDLLVHG
jgi:hypothetical protein